MREHIEKRITFFPQQSQPRGNCTQTGHLKTERFQTGQFEMFRLPCFEHKRLNQTRLLYTAVI